MLATLLVALRAPIAAARSRSLADREVPRRAAAVGVLRCAAWFERVVGLVSDRCVASPERIGVVHQSGPMSRGV